MTSGPARCDWDLAVISTPKSVALVYLFQHCRSELDILMVKLLLVCGSAPVPFWFRSDSAVSKFKLHHENEKILGLCEADALG